MILYITKALHETLLSLPSDPYITICVEHMCCVCVTTSCARTGSQDRRNECVGMRKSLKPSMHIYADMRMESNKPIGLSVTVHSLFPVKLKSQRFPELICLS